MVNKDLKFLQQAIKLKSGKKARVWYNKGSYTKESGLPKETITIYAKDYGVQLPRELRPENLTDIQTDYFEKDRARVKPKTKYYKDVLQALKKQEAFNKKILDKRKKRQGW